MCSLDVNLTVAAPLYSEMYSAVASLGCQNAWLGWPGPLVLVSCQPRLLRPQSVFRVCCDSRVVTQPRPAPAMSVMVTGQPITKHRSDHR